MHTRLPHPGIPGTALTVHAVVTGTDGRQPALILDDRRLWTREHHGLAPIDPTDPDPGIAYPRGVLCAFALPTACPRTEPVDVLDSGTCDAPGCAARRADAAARELLTLCTPDMGGDPLLDALVVDGWAHLLTFPFYVEPLGRHRFEGPWGTAPADPAACRPPTGPVPPRPTAPPTAPVAPAPPTGQPLAPPLAPPAARPTTRPANRAAARPTARLADRLADRAPQPAHAEHTGRPAHTPV